MNFIWQSLALSVLVVSLTACNNEKVRNQIDSRTDEANAGLQEAKAPAPPKSFNPLVVSDRVWAGSTSVRMRRGLPLPNRFEGPKGVTLVAADPLPLTEIAGIISSQTGIPVRIAPGTSTAAPSVTTTASGSGTAGGASSGALSSSFAGASGAVNSGSSSSLPRPSTIGAGTTLTVPNSANMMLAYEGPLSNILDQVAAYFGINWRYDGASITFSRVETRVFVIEAMPGTQSIGEDVSQDTNLGSNSGGSSSGGGGGGGGGTSALSQTATTKIELNVWDEINKTVQGIIGGVPGSSMVPAPSNGTITVTTTPEMMRIVADYVKQENRRLTRQVAINVEVYNVALEDQTDFSVTWRNALRRLQNFGFNFQGPAGPSGTSINPITFGDVDTGIASGAIEGAGNFGVAILNPSTVGQVSGLVSALSTLGDTSRVAQFPMTTLNNKPVSRRVGNDRNYVSKITSDTSSSTSSTALVSRTFEIGTIREGFSLLLTPRILDDGRIMLQYSMNLISLVGDEFEVFPRDAGPEDDQVQLPQTTNRVFVQQSLLKSGSTLIIGGFDDEQARQSSQGVGDPYNYLLGGGSSNRKSRTMIFIAITPQILDVPRAEQN